MSHTRQFFIAGLTLWAAIAGPRPSMAQEPIPPAPELTTNTSAEEQDPFLLREPETAEEFFRAAVQAQRLARPNLSRLYLQRLLDLNLTDEQLLELRDKFGPAAFSRLANQPELRPFSVQLSDRVTEVFRERGASPERISALIKALSGPLAEAFAARENLINAGDAIIPQIVKELRGDSSEIVRRQLLDVLVGIGGEALPAVHAGLNAPEDRIRVELLSVIGRIGDRRSIPYLFNAAFGPGQSVTVRSEARAALADIAQTSRLSAESVNPADASEQLSVAVKEQLGQLPIAIGADLPSAVESRIWIWDKKAGTVMPLAVSARDAAVFTAAQFARDAFLLAPNRVDARAQYLAALFELEALRAGALEPPTGPGTAYNLALAGGPDLAKSILRQSLSLSLDRAAIGALSALAQMASPSLLLDDDRLLIESLNGPASRVRLAAAVAILRLNPRDPFPESAKVVEILARALTSEARSMAVIIDPNAARGANLAGFVRQMGFDALVATTGQEGFRLATEQAEPSLVVVNLNVSRWPLSQTLANFRADNRTRQAPIIVVGPAVGEWQATSIDTGAYRYFRASASNDPRASVRRVLSGVPDSGYVVETATAAAFASQVRPLLSQVSQEPLTELERKNARALAAFWLAQIADTGRANVFPLQKAESALITALSEEDLAENALIALSEIPTATAQKAIANHLLAPTVAEPSKNFAADMLLRHVTRFGLLVDGATVRSISQLRQSANEPALVTTLAAFEGVVGTPSPELQESLSTFSNSPAVAPGE